MLIHDLRYSLRMLRRSPGLSAAAILSLALGIGANTSIFTWVRAVMLAPFPGVQQPQDVYVMATRNPSGSFYSVSYPDFVDVRTGVDGLAGVVVQDLSAVNLGSAGDAAGAQRVWGALVSGNYFDVLGVRAAQGRTFRPEEDEAPGRAPVVVISHRLWSTRFARSVGVVGTQVRINTQPFTVVGVAPPEFGGTFLGIGADLWIPMMMQAQIEAGADKLTARGQRWLQALARVAPDRSLAQARTALEGRSRQLAQAHPRSNEGLTLTLLPPSQSPWGAVTVLGPVLLVLLGVVATVLLITCANVANLLLARAVGRRREVAVRLALGAGRARLVRQLLTESLVLAGLGGLAGLVIARWSTGLLLAFMPPMDVQLHFALTLDRTVLAFTALVTVAAGLVFGLAPALQSSGGSLLDALRDEASGVASGAVARHLRSLLVVGQATLSIVLLIVAALFLQSLRNGQRADLGYRGGNLLFASVNVFPNGYTPQQGVAFARAAIDRLSSLPQVESASIGRRLPLGLSGRSSTRLEVEGYTPPRNEESSIGYNNVAPGYFATMGIPVLRGRELAWTDTEQAPGVVVINQALAQRYWPNQDAIGRRVRNGDQWYTVVGVVPTGKYRSVSEAATPYFYFSLLQSYRPDMILHVRTRGDAASAARAVRQTIAGLDPALPLYDVITSNEHLSIALVAQRMGGSLLGAFGGLALLLASVGLYGVMACAVSQRRREMGIRLALGAAPGQVRTAVIRDGVRLALWGAALGVTAAWFAAGLIASQLTGVSAHDPLTFVGVPLVLIGVAVVACYIPARRASRVDPATALRVS
jgi:predicted permease